MRPPVVPPDWPPPIPTEPTPNRVMSFRRSEEHTSELQSQSNLVCRLLLEKKKKNDENTTYPLIIIIQPHPHMYNPKITLAPLLICIQPQPHTDAAKLYREASHRSHIVLQC